MYSHNIEFTGEKISLPIPIIYFSSFMGDGVNDCLVIQNLCADSYFQVLQLINYQVYSFSYFPGWQRNLQTCLHEGSLVCFSKCSWNHPELHEESRWQGSSVEPISDNQGTCSAKEQNYQEHVGGDNVPLPDVHDQSTARHCTTVDGKEIDKMFHRN